MSADPSTRDTPEPPSRVLVNLGCGGVTPVRWINTDKSWRLILKSLLPGRTSPPGTPRIRYLNLARRWPFADGSVDVVYLSHVLEHLDTTIRKKVLDEAARVLKSGGVLRIVVPDLYQLCRNYITEFERGDAKAAGRLLYWQNLHRENIYPRDRSLLKKMYDYLQGYPKQHRIMYDRFTLREELSPDCWEDPLFCGYGRSVHIVEIVDVERTREICPSLYVEALRKDALSASM
ncbi:MAG: methyltransferase domain-containing protein [Chromatiaceae bacterium]